MTEVCLAKVSFPVNLHGHWCPSHSSLVEQHTRDWLLDPGSLTARLKAHSDSFRVQLLGQEILPCPEHEATDDIPAGEEVLAREVLLFLNEQPQVFARSLLPLSSLTGEQRELASLGNQSLGQVLFNHPKLTRKEFAIASFEQASTVAKLAETLGLDPQTTLWGRRSTFVIEDKPLMVAEVFLPGSIAYQNRQG